MDKKILVLDIETKPALVYTWRLFDANIGLDQVVAPGGILCVGAKWVGAKETFLYSEWEHGREGMLKAVWDMMNEADAIITYNGDKFDIPKLYGEFLLAGLKPPAPPTSIDILKTVRKLGFQSNKLAFIGPYLKVGKKVKTEGFTLWTAVIDGDAKAQRRMKNYCIGDVKLTERVYNLIKPYIRNHPTLGLATTAGACGACSSINVQSRGYRRTKAFKIQRLQCQDCGAWSDGARTKVD